MSTTREVLRQTLSKMIGDDLQLSLTADGAAAGATLVCSTLANKPDDFYNNWWTLITSGTYDGNSRQVLDFVSSTTPYGTITPYIAYGGKILSAVTFELHRWDTAILHDALNAAALECYPWLFTPLDDSSLTTNNWLPNGSFEDWAVATGPDFWTGGSASTAETTIKLFGANSAKLTRAGTDVYMEINHALWPRLRDLSGKTVSVYAWVYPSAASQMRINLWDGTTNSYSDYNTGTGAWELIKLENVEMQDDCTPVLRLRVEVDGAAYWDHCRLLGPYLYEYRLPTDFAEDPTQVFIQPTSDIAGDADYLGETAPPIEIHDWSIVDNGTNRFLKMKSAFESNKKIILRGLKKFTAMTGDTSTVPIDAPKTTLLCDYAAYWLYRQLANGAVSAEDRTNFMQLSEQWLGTFQRERARYAVPLKNPMMRFEYRA